MVKLTLRGVRFAEARAYNSVRKDRRAQERLR
jgi:hypothetical protein